MDLRISRSLVTLMSSFSGIRQKLDGWEWEANEIASIKTLKNFDVRGKKKEWAERFISHWD